MGPDMKKRDLDFFKKHLQQRMQELLSQADDTVSGMTTTNENFPDPTDRASLEADRNFMLRIRDRESKLIKRSSRPSNGSKTVLTASASPAVRRSPSNGSKHGR